MPRRMSAATKPAETKPSEQKDGKPDGKDAPKPGGADKLSVTEHEITAFGQPLKYRATAGTLAMRSEGMGPATSRTRPVRPGTTPRKPARLRRLVGSPPS